MSAPTFSSTFEGVRLQQGKDAVFCAVVAGSPAPAVTWTRRGRPLPSSDKYHLSHDGDSGRVALTIRGLGPGDEGQYACTAKNAYGSVTISVDIAPDGAKKSRGRALSPNCSRANMQTTQGM